MKQQDRDDFGINLGSRAAAAAVSFRKPMRLNLLAAGSLLFAILIGGAASAFETPQQVGTAFCAARMKNDEKQVRALLSSSLLEVIEEAETRNDAIAKATPEKPPLGDGIPWQGFPDQAPLCKAAETKQVSGRTEVLVRYEFPDAPDAGWTDRLLLVSAGSGLLIDDILYQIPANHTEQIGLRSVLFNAFDQ